MFGFQEETTDPPHGNAKIPRTTISERKEREKSLKKKKKRKKKNSEVFKLVKYAYKPKFITRKLKILIFILIEKKKKTRDYILNLIFQGYNKLNLLISKSNTLVSKRVTLKLWGFIKK